MKNLTITICLWLFAGLGAIAQTGNTHTVKRGESFALITKRYGITEEQLKAANPNKTVCYVGLKLELPKNPASQGTNSQVESNKTAAQSEHSLADTGKQTAKVENSHPKKKKKEFWKGIGDFFSGMGDVVVAVADGLSETGLIDNTGNVGTYIGGTADIVNLTRGTQSNYLGEATNGEYNSNGGNEDDVTVEKASTFVNSRLGKYDLSSIKEIDRRLAALRAEDEKLERQKSWSSMKNYNYANGKSQSEKRKLRKEKTDEIKKQTQDYLKTVPKEKRGKMSAYKIMQNSQKMSRNYSNSNYVGIKINGEQTLAIAQRQSEIQKEIKEYLKIKAELLNDPDIINEKSAFEKERSKRDKVNHDPKVRAARQKAANIRNYQKSQDIANDRAWKLRNDPTYMPEYVGEEREKKAKEFEEQGEYYRNKINE